ncbi:MAG: DUF58 domain-containing protein [Victivallales bacterium]|nr:DUF58 domain-containing protein [Victivallales bacterium]
MTPSELARKVRYIQLHTRRAVNDLLAGEYISAFKGTGMEFEEVREYQPGDDVKSIDWNVTAKQGRPYIKRFREERELTVIFAVDLSASGAFGSSELSKNELSAELCAMLALSAVKSNDKVGMAIFTDQLEKFIPPAKGSGNALRLVREILAFSPKHRGTDITGAIDYLGRILRRRAVVFLISDFQDSGYLEKLAAFSRKHDVIAITVADPDELSLPNVGLIELQDSETGKMLLVDTGSAAFRRRFAAAARLQLDNLGSAFRAAGIDQIVLQTHQDYAQKLITFFKTREHHH